MKKTNDEKNLETDENKKVTASKKTSTSTKKTTATRKTTKTPKVDETSEIEKTETTSEKPKRKPRAKKVENVIETQNIEETLEKPKRKTRAKKAEESEVETPKKRTTSKKKKQSTSEEIEEPKKTRKKAVSKKDVEEPKEIEEPEKIKKTSKKSTSTTKKIKKINEEIKPEEPQYINPDILKFEERLKQTRLSIIKKIEEDDELDDDFDELENLLSDDSETYIEDDITQNIEEIIEENSENTKSNSKLYYVYNIIIIVCIILILHSAVNIFLWQKYNIDNSNLIKKVSEITPITNVDNIAINESLQIEKKTYDFTELLSQNSDTVGWIQINNTNIDYPIVKAQDNYFYLNHAFDKSYNVAGWIYADYRNNCDDTDMNLIIYGHNRLNNNMFGTLENILSKPWLENEKNHYINYSSLNQSHIYQIFSAFICNHEDSVKYLKTDFTSNEDFNAYINNLKQLSFYDFKTDLNPTDKIITLYTCHGLNNERLIVCGKLLQK